jgi:Holliday junction DNA helicase RuvA
MIAFLRGKVVETDATVAVLDVDGVGYEVLVPTSVAASLPAPGGSARLFTRLVVRDDQMLLYGFGSPEERAMFDLLTGVTGVGPKVALAFLSSLRTDALRSAIVSGDVGALTIVPGVGKKVAQRVVVDLRDRLGGPSELPAEGPLTDVREALMSLGLTDREANEALSGVEIDGRESEDLLREALQKVGR